MNEDTRYSVVRTKRGPYIGSDNASLVRVSIDPARNVEQEVCIYTSEGRHEMTLAEAYSLREVLDRTLKRRKADCEAPRIE